MPLHKLFGWSVRLILSGFCWSLYGGSLLAWLIGLWLVKELITDVIRFAWGCLVSDSFLCCRSRDYHLVINTFNDTQL